MTTQARRRLAALEALPAPERIQTPEEMRAHNVAWAARCGLTEEPVAEVAVSPYGSRYLVRGGLRTPRGREPWPLVCSVWQTDNGDVGARLITAYPAYPA